MSNEIDKARDSLSKIAQDRIREEFTEFHIKRTEGFNQRIDLLELENKRLRNEVDRLKSEIQILMGSE